MSSLVSYELFTAKLGNNTCGFTSEGGAYETFVNNTGISVKGTIVVTSTTVYNAVDIAPADTNMAIGVIYENGVANGSLVKVFVYGKAEVLLKNTEIANYGYWCGVSDVAGRMYQESTSPTSTVKYNREIGHSLQANASGINVLSLIQLHFN
jgi:hypothetical protein